MEKMLVLVFNDESKAYEGLRALNDLHSEGSLTVYSTAVISKDSKGAIRVPDVGDPGPVGTAFGWATGGLIGLIGGPVGFVAGAAAGTMAGSLYDLARVGVSSDFLDEVSRSLSPGKTAVVAEVNEAWVTPVDTRIEALGGKVLRQARNEFVDAQIGRDIDATRAEIKDLKAEYNREAGEAKAKLQTKIYAAQLRLQAQQNKIKETIDNLRTEREAKVKSLRQQAAATRSDVKAAIEKRIAETEADNDARNEKLNKAWQLIKEAAAS